ncbi:hypothetical protein [Novilysobacter erysipheiresistens]|uniref:Uncharacterized protein n=1 Tax=Novilysobacter erysipheiresistens TaxID=1749332 RepID=A0ABU7YX16_9GAMM
MNRLSRVVVVTLSVASAAACASMDEQSARISPQPAAIDTDSAYMSRVEQIARRRGIEVVWINPPGTDEPFATEE